LKLARSLFEFLLSRLNRAIGEDEQMRYLLLLMQMLDLELINQSQATPLRTSLNELFRKIAARKIKTEEGNGFLLNEMVAAVNEVILRLEQRLNQALMDKESAEAEARSLRPAKVVE